MIDAVWFERISNGLLALCTGLAAVLAVRKPDGTVSEVAF